MGCGISSTLDGLKQNSPSTKSVYLEGRALGPKGGRDLADAIAMNTSCLKMNLTGCLLGDEGASALFEAFETNTSCLELLVGGNDIKAAGVHIHVHTYTHMRTPKQQRGYLRRGAVEASVDFHVLPGRRRALSASIRLLFVIVSFHFISKKTWARFSK